MQEACNRTAVVHPFSFVATDGPAWGLGPTCHVTSAPVTTCKETAPPLAPMPHLLDYRTSAATRGSPERDPTVPIKCDDHGSVSDSIILSLCAEAWRLLSHQATAKLSTMSTNQLKNSEPNHAPGLRPGRMREQQGRSRHHKKN
jgi:hypothetical protein